jgi:NAD(P)-dependent dehydrogenase (short-subunit alcohol dehydrogenase family)
MNPSKVMLITGGTKGIGKAIAQHHADLGYRVFTTSRSKSASAGAIEIVPLEITDEQSVERCVNHVMNKAGRIDVLVNNAGYDLYGALEETTFAMFEHQIDVNLFGAVRIIKAMLPIMREQRSGRIVNISSLGGLIGLPLNSAYTASKFALEGLVESVRLEMLPFNVYLSLIEPGAVATDTLDESIQEVQLLNSPYSERRSAMVKRMRKDGANSTVKPLDIANAVQRACEDAYPRLRYPVGSQAVWVPRMKAQLPQSLFEKMMRKIFP